MRGLKPVEVAEVSRRLEIQSTDGERHRMEHSRATHRSVWQRQSLMVLKMDSRLRSAKIFTTILVHAFHVFFDPKQSYTDGSSDTT